MTDTNPSSLTSRLGDAASAAARRWGGFRRFIAARPLSGFWCGVALGAALIGVPAGAIFF